MIKYVPKEIIRNYNNTVYVYIKLSGPHFLNNQKQLLNTCFESDISPEAGRSHVQFLFSSLKYKKKTLRIFKSNQKKEMFLLNIYILY